MFGKEKNKSIVDLAKEFDDGSISSQASNQPESPADTSVPRSTHISDQVGSLLENLKGVHDYVEFNLPSLGKPYENYNSDVIGIRPLRFSDEKNIQQHALGDRALDGLNLILASCLQGPEYLELTLPDKLFALFKLRQLSYGSEYPLESTCEKCSHKNQIKFELSSMEVNYLENSINEITNVYLPDSKKNAIVGILRTKDENAMAEIKDVIHSLPSYVKSIEGISDINVITLFLEGTTVKDVGVIRSAIFNPTYGIAQDSEYVCEKCMEKNDLTVSVNANFFSPS